MAGKFVIAARAEEELHTTPKLTNQLFEDSHNASFVSVVSWISCLWYRRVFCVLCCVTYLMGQRDCWRFFFSILYLLLYISCVRDNESVLWFLSSFSYSHTSSSDQPTCHHHNYIAFFTFFIYDFLVLTFHYFLYFLFSFRFISLHLFYVFLHASFTTQNYDLFRALCRVSLVLFLCSGCVMCVGWW